MINNACQICPHKKQGRRKYLQDTNYKMRGRVVAPLETTCCTAGLLSASSSTLKEVQQECIWLGWSPITTLGKRYLWKRKNWKCKVSWEKVHLTIKQYTHLCFPIALSIHGKYRNVTSGNATYKNGNRMLWLDWISCPPIALLEKIIQTILITV